jgi:hypothetical protein
MYKIHNEFEVYAIMELQNGMNIIHTVLWIVFTRKEFIYLVKGIRVYVST